ncbi:MAG: DNA mismatch repair endonuclease MutL [Bryobacteraceae bacterium]
MGRIRVLSDQVANKIAAGEVVERPASVVKELLENSLDAGAASLKVEVESGGKRLIRVSDDGCGMLRDDALLAFERHATSKLRDVKDLTCISTLGFRGEALPSIASVSRLVLETRSAEETTGMRVEISGGKLLRAEETALATGTTVTVRDLFFNVPARRKFLRSEQTELAHIAALVTHYSLAHPDKSFLLRSGASELLSATPVSGLRDRVYQVFGGQILEELVELGQRERELMLPPPDVPRQADEGGQCAPPQAEHRLFRLSGFVSRPQYQKLNRNSVYLFVNRRLIRDRLLMHAVSAAYHNLMPPACYPFALLFLDCGYEEVDVNVHPSKTEVRFRHGSFVHDFVRDSIREVLMKTRPVSSLPPPAVAAGSGGPQRAATFPFSEYTTRMEQQAWSGEPSPVIPLPEQENPADLPLHIIETAPRPSPVDQPPLRIRIPETHTGFPAGPWQEAPAGTAAVGDLRPLGQLHESFIVAAGRDGLWIIDQHVAHERVLFEQLLRQTREGTVESQRLLMPVIVELTPAQQIEYARIAEELHAAGFESEPFGQRTIAVKAVPAGVRAGDVEKILSEILEIAESELRGRSLDDLRRAMAASIACRAAIKINTKLEQAKMEWLLAELAATQCPMSCPHGRPVALRFSMRDILRGFHRI